MLILTLVVYVTVPKDAHTSVRERQLYQYFSYGLAELYNMNAKVSLLSMGTRYYLHHDIF